MNPIQQAQQAYSPEHAPMRSPRSIELQILGEITSRLRQAAGATDSTSFARLASALHDNRRLWVHLAADVADGGNRLPAALRAQIFYLAEFTELHSRRVLREDADPAILIDINTSVMQGLDGTLSAAVPA